MRSSVSVNLKDSNRARLKSFQKEGNDEKDKWKCIICDAPNLLGTEKCGGCGVVCGLLDELKNFKENTKAAIQEWACAICTLLNSPEDTICKACLNHRSDPRTETGSESEEGPLLYSRVDLTFMSGRSGEFIKYMNKVVLPSQQAVVRKIKDDEKQYPKEMITSGLCERHNFSMLSTVLVD